MRDEGLRLKVYRCTAGKLTIGVGRNLDDVGISADETKELGITKASAIKNGITREQAMALLDNDIDRVDDGLDKHISWWRKLDPIRQRVLVNMGFNLGVRGLLKWTNTLAFIRTGRFEQAARGMEGSLWRRQVGARAVRLISMMRHG